MPPPLRSTATATGLPSKTHSLVNVPATFSYAPSQLTPTRDQGTCGDCWAFAITGMIADRVKLFSKIEVPLSVQNLIECTPGFGPPCDGNDVGYALRHLPPLFPEALFPYTQTQSRRVPDCPQVDLQQVYHVTDHLPAVLSGKGKKLIENMKAHIYHEGPIVGALLRVPSDFLYYDGKTIYTPPSSYKSAGGHAIEIVGWGEKDNVPYWICRNSWGASWPVNPSIGPGFFMIRQGVNACGIEEVAYTTAFTVKNPKEIVPATPNFIIGYIHVPFHEGVYNQTDLTILILILIGGVWLYSRKRR
jgi:hypothetical protein